MPRPPSMEQGHANDFQLEIWCDIENYEKLYQISNLGRVKSLEKIVPCRYSFLIKRKERILKPAPTSRGYLSVRFSKEGKCKTHIIHQLVGKYFIKKRKKIYNQINHKDGNKLNNTVKNLEWTTQSLNQIHALKLGLQKSKKYAKT